MQLHKLTGLEGNLANHNPSSGEAEAQLHELADAVVQLYRDVARYLEDFVFGSVVDDRITGVVLAPDAEQYVHLGEDLQKTMESQTIAISFSHLLDHARHR
jgi:hypothetical protein